MEAIGRLAGGVAHDFNNYLAAIKGYASLLSRELPPAGPLHDDLAQIATAAEAAIALTRQLLTLGRKTDVNLRVIDLNSVVTETADSLGQMLGEHIQLCMRKTAVSANITADPGQVRQVIVNLAINARDAMLQGGRLTIETANVEIDAAGAEKHPGASPGTYVMLAVSDTGAGMDEETLQHVFEPFFTTKPEGEGAGMGLATVHGIVEQSGGHVTVHSQLGEGTTFAAYFPCTRAPEITPPLPGEETRPAGQTEGGSETILVVEDHDSVRSFLAKALNLSGYTVLEASRPTEALSLVEDRNKQIDLLISDVIMPEMNGPELAKQIKALLPEMLVLYVSGYPKDSIPDQRVRATELLAKPFSPEELCRRVRQMLDSSVKKD